MELYGADAVGFVRASGETKALATADASEEPLYRIDRVMTWTLDGKAIGVGRGQAV